MAALCGGCYDDKGNYSYHDINEVVISGIDPSYTVLLGESLEINPKLMMSMDAAGNEDDYAYEWFAISNDALATSTARQNIAATKNLNAPIAIPAGSYNAYFRVTDKNTGVNFLSPFNLNVVSSIYEGFLVLSNIGGTARLDMLSYLDNEFIQYNDVITRVGSSLPQLRNPYKVYCYPSGLSMDGDGYRIYLLSETMGTRIDPETFDYQIEYKIEYEAASLAIDNLNAQDLVRSSVLIPSASWVYSSGNVYYAMSVLSMKYGLPVNAYPDSKPFKVAPFMACGDMDAILFNIDDRRFVQHGFASEYCTNLNNPKDPKFDYNIGMDLIYMETNYSGWVYAILHDGSKYHIAKFNMNAVQDHFSEIVATDFAQADNYAVSPDLGYLFYSVGGKVYEYDLSLKTTKLMIDKGSHEISLLTFNYFFNGGSNANYKEWRNWLIVGSYDPQGKSGENGTLSLYHVPPVNGDLEHKYSWGGLGEIVSVTYRER